MINETNIKRFCKDDISMIENYDKAIADKTQTWDCHHRDEIRTLPSGMTVIRSRQDLKDAGRYYGCPANELIFLTPNEHRRLHNAGIKREPFSAEHKQKLSEAKKGKTHAPLSEETKKKISESWKGKKRGPFSDEHRQKIADARKGKTHSEETRQKMREAWAKRKSTKYK